MVDQLNLKGYNMKVEHIAEGMIRVTMQSCFTGHYNTMELPIREGQIHYWKQSRKPIQNVFPSLSAEQREFLMTGSTAQEWDDHVASCMLD